jgi:hypothetical protein
VARLVRFYHLDPERLASMPEWLFQPLEDHLWAVRAEEMSQALAVALSPYSRDVLSAVQGEIERQHAAYLPEETIEIIEHDPAKAAEWFESIGAQVVH